MSVKSLMWRGKKILITGGAGFLASGIARFLGDTECRILRLDMPGAAFPSLVVRARIEDWEADIRGISLWENVLDGVDVVFHLAAQTSVSIADRNPSADMSVNVAPLLGLLETCARKGWHPVVLFAGTATECGLTDMVPVDESLPDRPITIYDLHKLMAESYLEYFARRGAVRGAVLRLANVYGPGPRSSSADRGVLNMLIRRAIAGETLTVYGQGDRVRDYVCVDDVAEAFCAAVEAMDSVNGGHFLIGSGKGHTITQAVELVAERVAIRTGRRAPVTHVTPSRPLSPIEERNFVANITRFAKATGWVPRTNLAEGIDRTVDFFLSEKRARG